jgi:hypothetical protein
MAHRTKTVKQQFSISEEAEKSFERLAAGLHKAAATHVKKEILEACIGLTAGNYYIALGRIQDLCKRD